MRIRRWLVRVAEKLARRYYEGPEPPRRLAQEVASFVAVHPDANLGDWMRFATEHGNECYRSGYTRGVERSVRDLNLATEPKLLESAEQRHTAEWVDLIPSEGEVQAALEERKEALEKLSPEDRLLYMDQLGQRMGGWRVVLLPHERKKRS